MISAIPHRFTTVKVGEDTSNWFRKKDCPNVEVDALGIYAFPARSTLSLSPISEEAARGLLAEITGQRGAWESWSISNQSDWTFRHQKQTPLAQKSMPVLSNT